MNVETSNFNIWQILAGIGLFLFGMQLMETAIRHLAGRSFKVFLKRQTAQPLRAVIAGLLVTALLQSSSIVNLLVLAFVGAGILTMRNAMAVILGSNLGSTVYNWIVVYLGFKFDIQSFAFPMMAIGAIGIIFFQSNKKVMHWSHLGFGISLLFLGLSNIKGGVETLVTTVDLSFFNEYGNVVFVLIGFVITAIVQSSATTVVITLTALNAGILSFDAAACLVIGSEVGTSVKTILGSIGTVPDKKRVALGNFLQNITSSGVALLLLTPLIFLIQSKMGIKDPLVALVTFQSLINLIGIIIFFPLLPLFSGWLEKQFTHEEQRTSKYINKLLLDEPEVAIAALEKEGKRLLWNIAELNRKGLEINPESASSENEISHIRDKSYSEHYEMVKHLNGEIIDFCLELQNKEASEEYKNRIQDLMEMFHQTMNAAKSVKDIRHNIKELRDSADDLLHNVYKEIRKSESAFYKKVNDIISSDSETISKDLATLTYDTRSVHDRFITDIYGFSLSKKLHDLELATLMNVLNEIQSSHNSIIDAFTILHGLNKKV